MVGKKYKNYFRIRPLLVAILFAFSVLAGAFQGGLTAQAAGGTATWTGGGGDNKFSTAGNWAEGSMPENGDMLILSHVPQNPGDPEKWFGVTLDNDVDVVFSGVRTVYSPDRSVQRFDSYYLKNLIRLQGGAVWDLGGNDVGIRPGSGVKVTGDFTIRRGMYIDSIDVDGRLIIDIEDSTVLIPNDLSVGSIEVRNGSGVRFGNCVYDVMVSVPITLGGGDSTKESPTVDHGCLRGFGPSTVTFTDAILASDVQVQLGDLATLKINNIAKNGFSIGRADGYHGTLKVGDDIYKTEERTTRVEDSMPDSSLTAYYKETVVLNGKRGNVNVRHGATLGGNGTANRVYVDYGGTISPGESPGKLAILERLTVEGLYRAELLNSSSYDQLEVGSGHTGSDPAVILNHSDYNEELIPKLEIVLYKGYSIKKGDTFTIIDNKSQQPVSGIFRGLEEGSQFEVDNITFSITYQGGDGNDVVITALNTGSDPSAPNTGAFNFATTNTLLLAVLGAASALVMVVGARRLAAKR